MGDVGGGDEADYDYARDRDEDEDVGTRATCEECGGALRTDEVTRWLVCTVCSVQSQHETRALVNDDEFVQRPPQAGFSARHFRKARRAKSAPLPSPLAPEKY